MFLEINKAKCINVNGELINTWMLVLNQSQWDNILIQYYKIILNYGNRHMCVVFRLCLRVYSLLLTEGPSITQVIEVTGTPPPPRRRRYSCHINSTHLCCFKLWLYNTLTAEATPLSYRLCIQLQSNNISFMLVN